MKTQETPDNSTSTATDVSELCRRLGRFRISRVVLREKPEQLKTLFAQVVVVEAQMRWERDSVEYLAMSDAFEVLPEGIMAPVYEATFHAGNETQTERWELSKSLLQY